MFQVYQRSMAAFWPEVHSCYFRVSLPKAKLYCDVVKNSLLVVYYYDEKYFLKVKGLLLIVHYDEQLFYSHACRTCISTGIYKKSNYEHQQQMTKTAPHVYFY